MLKDARRRINDHSWPQTEYIGGSWSIIAPGTPGGVDHCSLITYTAYFEREETQSMTIKEMTEIQPENIENLEHHIMSETHVNCPDLHYAYHIIATIKRHWRTQDLEVTISLKDNANKQWEPGVKGFILRENSTYTSVVRRKKALGIQTIEEAKLKVKELTAEIIRNRAHEVFVKDGIPQILRR